MKKSRSFSIALLVACTSIVPPVQSALAGAAPSSNRDTSVDEEEHFFGGPLDSEERAIVVALTPAQVDAIDAAILLDVPARWAKVAMVLGKQLKLRSGVPDDVPLEYYWQRLAGLVDQGQVEVQGDLRRARYSEVRRH
jgi:hypothetical protein